MHLLPLPSTKTSHVSQSSDVVTVVKVSIHPDVVFLGGCGVDVGSQELESGSPRMWDALQIGKGDKMAAGKSVVTP